MKSSPVALIGLLLVSPVGAGASPPDSPPAFEADREAILAMAGDFEVTFRFEETISLSPGYEPKDPYLEHAAETVKVAADDGRSITLQHLLLDQDSGRVIKHWKQVWIYEDTDIYAFEGGKSWVASQLPPDEVAGTWSQRVSQVDDSPRYESVGRWVHQDGVSSWTSAPTRRPLPRREYTSRDDYEVMLGTNRQTITPAGWTHEQDNLKQVAPGGTILCREAGLNTYSRTEAIDFTKANEYWDETAPFWKAVSERWDQEFERAGKLAFASEVGGPPMYKQLFDLARKSADGELAPGPETRAAIDEIVTKFLAQN
ncbi:hypothetical protein BH23VER1_BH23VER1_37630 [soil metagenome]